MPAGEWAIKRIEVTPDANTTFVAGLASVEAAYKNP
jgi:hypothetical protein